MLEVVMSYAWPCIMRLRVGLSGECVLMRLSGSVGATRGALLRPRELYARAAALAGWQRPQWASRTGRAPGHRSTDGGGADTAAVRTGVSTHRPVSPVLASDLSDLASPHGRGQDESSTRKYSAICRATADYFGAIFPHSLRHLHCLVSSLAPAAALFLGWLVPTDMPRGDMDKILLPEQSRYSGEHLSPANCFVREESTLKVGLSEQETNNSGLCSKNSPEAP